MKFHCCILVFVLNHFAFSEKPADPTPPPPSQIQPPKPAKRSILKYTPPKDTASGQRIDGDGGSRNEPKYKLPNYLCTLTPKSGAALTTLPQPSLFSYVSDPVKMEFRVTLIEPKVAKPAFIFAVSQCTPGIHRLNLADYGVTLKPGVEYTWTVAIRPDQKNRSADLPATGIIKRIEPDVALAEKIKAASNTDLALVYAEAGIWYDALAVLQDQINASPKDESLRELRSEFLRSAGLDQAANFKNQ